MLDGVLCLQDRPVLELLILDRVALGGVAYPHDDAHALVLAVEGHHTAGRRAEPDEGSPDYISEGCADVRGWQGDRRQ